MARLTLSLIVMGNIAGAYGMNSPTVFSRTETNSSPMNKCADVMGCSNSPQYRVEKKENPPSFHLESSLESPKHEKEILSDMAALGVSHYQGINGFEQSFQKAGSFFCSVLQARDKMKHESPKSVALANLYYGKMILRGEHEAWKNNTKRDEVAYQYLKKACEQKVDLQVAAQATVTLSFLYYLRGVKEKNNTFIDQSILGCNRVIELAHDEEAVLTAKLVLSDAAYTGNGMKQDIRSALQYAKEVALQNKYERESLKAYLQCAFLYMKGIDKRDWNIENGGYAEAYLVPPRSQSQYEDIKDKAEKLYRVLNSKLQASIYQEGLAYIRRAVPLNGYVLDFWDKLGAQGIRTLEDLKAREPGSYKFAIERAEWNFEQAAFQNHNPEARAAAIHALAWIYKQTGRETEFGEYARVQGWLEIAPKNQ